MSGSLGVLRSRLGNVHADAVPVTDAVLGRVRVGAAICAAIAFVIALISAGSGSPFLILSALALLAVLWFSLAAERHQRETAAAVARVAAHLRPEDGARHALDGALRELLEVFGAHTVVLVARDDSQGHIYRRAAALTGDAPAADAALAPEEERAYLFDAPAGAWAASDAGDRVAARVLDDEGRHARPTTMALPDALRAAHRFRSVLGVSSSGGHWTQRILLFDARAGIHELRMLQGISRQIGPAIYGIERLGRLRSRIGAAERARVARDLHDGIIQALIGLEMQVHVWRREADSDPAAESKLGHIQAALRAEVLELRDLIEQMKTVPVEPKHVQEHLAALVERFQRESGIDARYISEIDDLALSPHACEEIVRIIQEALVNVRKHSGARHVLVRASAPPGCWKFEVDDDGRGFEFAGRRSQAELDIERKGPVIIKERVRAMGGELAIESAPGHGARVEVFLARGTRG